MSVACTVLLQMVFLGINKVDTDMYMYLPTFVYNRKVFQRVILWGY